MYLILLVLLLLYYFRIYNDLKELMKTKESNNYIYKNIKFILIYQKGDNIKECLDSLLKQKIKANKIIIIGKNIRIKNRYIKLYEKKYSKKLINSIIKDYYQKNDIIGIFRTNTIFNNHLIEKVINFFNRYQTGKLYILSDILTNNVFLKKYNFYHQLNCYSMNQSYDYFLNLNHKNGSILNSFLVTKIINLNPLQFIFYDYNIITSNIYLLFRYLIIYLYPSLFFIGYILQLIFQIKVIYDNLSFNQVLESEIVYIYLGNLLIYLKYFLPKIRLNVKTIELKRDSNEYLIPDLKLIDSTKNGLIYQVNNSNLKVLNLFGSDYEKGFAYGKLCVEDFNKMVITLENIYKNMVPTNLEMKKLRNNNRSMKDCLLEIYNKIKKYIGSNHINMIKGISDGTGIKLDDIIAITFIPELYHQHCMLLTKLDKKENLFLRTLDYFFYNDSHILRIYHNKNKNSYCELGIPGSIWTITSVSEKLLCLGETNGKLKNNNFLGTPFYLYFKDIMEKCETLDQSINFLKKITRNNNIFIMMSSLLENESLLIESTNDIKEYNKTNFIEYLNKYSNNKTARINEEVIFEYSDPDLLNRTLLSFDNFSIENIKNNILKLFRTGGNHTMIVNNKFQMFIQFNNKNNPGYDRELYLFNLKQLFNKKIQ